MIATIGIARQRQFWDWRELSGGLNAGIPNQNSTGWEKPTIVSDPLNDETVMVKAQNSAGASGYAVSMKDRRRGGGKVEGEIG